MREFHVLNLGAGVQSTAVYLLSVDGEIRRFDYAIFADTQEEPRAVYEHLGWLQSLKGPPILIRTKSKLGDDLLREENSNGGRFASIPAFTTARRLEDRETPVTGCEVGMLPRQCTKEYKIDVVNQTIRREIVGLKSRQHMPKDIRIVQYFGISTDESRRAVRITKRFEDSKFASPAYPLLEREWSRDDCKRYLAGRVPHVVPKSACVFCPYRNAREWQEMKNNDPEAWRRACEVDEGLRKPGIVANRGLDEQMFLHRSCLPLTLIDFQAEIARQKEKDMFALMGCEEGMCGL